MVLFWVTPRSSKHHSEFLFETYFLQTFYPHPQDFSRTPPGHFPLLSLLPTAELKHFWDARRARWPSLSLSLSPRPRRHRQPHSSVHQGPVGTGQDKLPGKRELLVPWPVQLHCFLFLRIHPALYWVICPVFFFFPCDTEAASSPCYSENYSHRMESLNCSIHYPGESYPTV